jgi:hypothetical protein
VLVTELNVPVNAKRKRELLKNTTTKNLLEQLGHKEELLQQYYTFKLGT